MSNDAPTEATDLSMIKEVCLTTADEKEWRKLLPANRSVFGSVEYARVCERFRGSTARLFAIQSEQASICHPLFLRPVSDLPFVSEDVSKWDAGTPDFTGPLMNGHDESLPSNFKDCHDVFMQTQGIIAEFAHLHPWSNGVGLLGEGCTHNRDIIWIDVSETPETLLKDHFEHSCRKNIKKAQREGVRIVTDSSDERIGEFYRIYLGTMRRNQALDRYSFSLEYFRTLRDELPHNTRFVFAEHGDKIIAATLYMYDDEDVYSFLGGADAEFNALRPTNLVVWDTIQWAHQSGKRRLILGGGFRPNDGIYQFKATFSSLRQPFYIYKRIHRSDDYSVLDQRCREYNGLRDEHVDYFPSYRFVAD